eukprot:5665199-Prymnesium_polylepis.1
MSGAGDSKSKEDAESNARLVAALFDSVEEAAGALEKSKDVSSHLQLDYDDNGQPTQLRFVYVDEQTCSAPHTARSISRQTWARDLCSVVSLRLSQRALRGSTCMLRDHVNAVQTSHSC